MVAGKNTVGVGYGGRVEAKPAVAPWRGPLDANTASASFGRGVLLGDRIGARLVFKTVFNVFCLVVMSLLRSFCTLARWARVLPSAHAFACAARKEHELKECRRGQPAACCASLFFAVYREPHYT